LYYINWLICKIIINSSGHKKEQKITAEWRFCVKTSNIKKLNYVCVFKNFYDFFLSLIAGFKKPLHSRRISPTAVWIPWNVTTMDSYVFGIALDDRDVPSVCDISWLTISGRQFFPWERIRQGEKMFDITITVAVMG
jgi:hypothetical protein